MTLALVAIIVLALCLVGQSAVQAWSHARAEKERATVWGLLIERTKKAEASDAARIERLKDAVREEHSRAVSRAPNRAPVDDDGDAAAPDAMSELRTTSVHDLDVIRRRVIRDAARKHEAQMAAAAEHIIPAAVREAGGLDGGG